MDKEKRILSYTISYLLIGLFICLIGISNVFAATYTPSNYKAQLYDNINGSLTSVDTYQETDGDNYYYGFIGLTAYTSGGAWGISSPIPLIANHTYSMTVDPYAVGCGYTILSSVNRIGVGTSMSNAKSSYENNTNVTEKFSQAVSNSRYIQYVFTPSINSSYIVFPYATTSTCSSTTNQLSNIVIEDLGEGGVTQEQINTSLNNQTTEIESSINNSTNTITGAIGETENNINSNIDDMEDAIVESNKETQEVIKDQFNSCRDSYNLLNYGTQTFTNYYQQTGLNIPAGTYTFSAKITSDDTENKYSRVYFYDINSNSLGSITLNRNSRQSGTITLSSTAVRVTILAATNYTNSKDKTATWEDIMLNEGTTSKPYEPYGEICSNKIDDTNDKLDGIQGSLTDSSSPNTSELENSAGWLPPGPLDSVLNLPLSLFNALTTNLNKSCNPINIPLPYVNKNITLPCINTLYEQIGINTFLSWIGVIVSGLMLYSYLLKLYKWIEDRISLNETHNVDSWGGL